MIQLTAAENTASLPTSSLPKSKTPYDRRESGGKIEKGLPEPEIVSGLIVRTGSTNVGDRCVKTAPVFRGARGILSSSPRKALETLRARPESEVHQEQRNMIQQPATDITASRPPPLSFAF